MSIRGRIAKQKTKIYQFLKRHPFLDAMQYVLRNYKNKDKCRDAANRNGFVLKCHSNGNANRDKCIYHICFGEPEFGFFALFRTTLKYLAYADRFGFCPIVEWSRPIPYAEKEAVLGTNNPFEYYFDQPTEISLEEVGVSYNVFESEEVHVVDSFLNREIPDGENGYIMSEQFIDYLAAIAHKYIRLNAWTSGYIKEQVEKITKGKKTLGVHVRGSDFKLGYNNHPIIVLVEDYIDSAKELLQKGDYEQIFLATDDMTALDKFKKFFSEKLVYYTDVTRTDGEVSVAFSQSERKNHHYLLGLEVLRDMYSLASCDGLVAGISQVSNCARIMRKSWGNEYKDMKILDKGINHTSNNFVG